MARKGYLPGGIGEAAQLFGGRKLSTAIQEYKGHYFLTGSIPYNLTKEVRSGFSVSRGSLTWGSLQEVIEALRGEGITRFQMPDCSWSE